MGLSVGPARWWPWSLKTKISYASSVRLSISPLLKHGLPFLYRNTVLYLGVFGCRYLTPFVSLAHTYKYTCMYTNVMCIYMHIYICMHIHTSWHTRRRGRWKPQGWVWRNGRRAAPPRRGRLSKRPRHAARHIALHFRTRGQSSAEFCRVVERNEDDWRFVRCLLCSFLLCRWWRWCWRSRGEECVGGCG